MGDLVALVNVSANLYPSCIVWQATSFEWPSRSDLGVLHQRQQVVYLLGPSGSGKSTLLQLLASGQPEEHGRVMAREMEA